MSSRISGDVMLVGSMPYEDAEAVLRKAGRALSGHAGFLPGSAIDWNFENPDDWPTLYRAYNDRIREEIACTTTRPPPQPSSQPPTTR